MTLYHINDGGNPTPCRAVKGGCPFAKAGETARGFRLFEAGTALGRIGERGTLRRWADKHEA